MILFIIFELRLTNKIKVNYFDRDIMSKFSVTKE